MFKLCFASGHGGATNEIKMLCKQSGVQLVLPGTETQQPLRHLVKDAEAQIHQATLLHTMDEIKQAVEKKEINAWLVARPETIEGIREHFGTSIPIIARHSVNSFEKYKKLGLQNFISPSRTALRQLGLPNQWLSVKVRDFNYTPYKSEILPASQRKGYYSYIHHFQQYWKRAFNFYSEVATLLDGAVPIEYYGRENPAGDINDHKTMATSKATIHIKDGQVCCNAPINSICSGIPVLMDYETLHKLGMEDYIIHQVSGLLFDTPAECIKWIQVLENDNDFLDELSRRTREFARLKCQYTSQDYLQFRNFLYKAR